MVQTQTKTQTVNAVDVETLKNLADAIREDAALGEFQFRANNQWETRGRNHTQIQDFYGAGREDDTRKKAFSLDADEPKVFAGDDLAPNPVEHLLHALASCITTTMVYHASLNGIQIESVESELVGDLDVRGVMGLSDNMPKGYKAIHARVKVRSAAPAQTLEEFIKFSPVYNSLKGSVPIEVTVEKT